MSKTIQANPHNTLIINHLHHNHKNQKMRKNHNTIQPQHTPSIFSTFIVFLGAISFPRMKYLCIILVLVLSLCAQGQTDPHYTMFMFGKQLFNPAYVGSRDVTSLQFQYRDQWAGIPGAPRTISVMADGPAGSYMRTSRPVALGISISAEKTGVETFNHLRTYYAYRIKFSSGTLSLGLSAGGILYSAAYSQLHPQQQIDKNLTTDIRNRLLPNFGTGAYWYTPRFYVGLSAPTLLRNTYDQYGTRLARQVRSAYLMAGYVHQLTDEVQLKPQVLLRYAGTSLYRLPLSADFNLTAIAYNRLMVGTSYRTDKSVAFIAQMQVTTHINLGYSYDLMMNDFTPFARGAHEFVLGYDFSHNPLKFIATRFSSSF